MFIINVLENEFYDNLKIYIPYSHFIDSNLWIVKPTDLCQGKCLEVLDDLKKIYKKIKQFFNGIEVQNESEESITTDKYKQQLQNLNSKDDVHFNPILEDNEIKNPSQEVINKDNNEDENNDNSLKPNKAIKINKRILANLNVNASLKIENKKIAVLNNDNKEINKELKSNEGEAKLKKEGSAFVEKKKIKYFSNSIIIQKYIENPCLYKNRKFDIRVWVLITHEYKVFMFKEGHIKTSSHEYNLQNKNSFIHITNYSLQKYSSEFGKHELGNEASYSDLNVILLYIIYILGTFKSYRS